VVPGAELRNDEGGQLMKKIIASCLLAGFLATQPAFADTLSDTVAQAPAATNPFTSASRLLIVEGTPPLARAHQVSMPNSLSYFMSGGLHGDLVAYPAWANDLCFVQYKTDATRPWCLGNYGFATNDTATTTLPLVRIQRDTTQTSIGPYVGEASNLSVKTNILTDIRNSEAALIVAIEERVPNTTSGASHCANGNTHCNLVGAHIEADRLATATGTTSWMWGANILAHDLTARASSVSGGGAMLGAEIDVFAAGPDDSNVRIGIDLVLGDLGVVSVDGPSTFFIGQRIRPAGGTILTGLDINGDGGALGGAITTGIHLNVDNTGILVDTTTPSKFWATVRTPTFTSMHLGTTTNTNNAVLHDIGFWGYNSTNTFLTEQKYAYIRGEIVSNTAGAEAGRMDFFTMQAGAAGGELGIGGGVKVGAPTGSFKGSGTLNIQGAYWADGTTGVTCAGAPTGAFATKNGIVTAC
jgi:hypothetical protein